MTTCNGPSLKVERILRAIAGFFLILSTVLYFSHSPKWIWFMFFIGVNLFQSAFTNWCPVISMLKGVLREESSKA